jgi:signal transduction histidine kinase
VSPTLRTICRRPLTAACWRETFYLVASLVTGVAGFTFIVSAGSTALGLIVVIVGIPLAVLIAHIDRWWCAIERRRTASVLGRPVRGNYPPARGEGWIARFLSVLSDRQTWFDALWMLAALPLGIVAFTIGVTVWSTTLGLLTYPIWGWSVPGWLHDHVVFFSIVLPFLSPFAAIAAAWIVRGVALAQAQVMVALLGPGRRALEERVQTLSETRAGAVDAATTELQRVERDLHDGAQARLVALAMDLGLAEQRLAQADPDTALEHVSNARGQAQAAMAELRALVRGIGPSILQDRGLDAALTALVSGRHPPVNLAVDLPDAPAGPRETAVYFVVAEALANARKHAGASSISVRVWEDGARELVAEVVDDGSGGADSEGYGLAGLRKRVAALDGTLSVDSPPGGPTIVRAELPCAS